MIFFPSTWGQHQIGFTQLASSQIFIGSPFHIRVGTPLNLDYVGGDQIPIGQPFQGFPPAVYVSRTLQGFPLPS